VCSSDLKSRHPNGLLLEGHLEVTLPLAMIPFFQEEMSMNAKMEFSLLSVVRTAAAAMALGAASMTYAATAVDVTWNPSAAGITTNGPFTFDNITSKTYASITLSSPGPTGTFTENGFIDLNTFTLNGGAIPTQIPVVGFPGSGAAADYDLYIRFTATGNFTFSDPQTATGVVTGITYQLFGSSTPATYSFSGGVGGSWTITTPPGSQLAHGSIVGTGTTSLSGSGTAGVSSNANVLANVVADVPAFFVAPPPSTLSINMAFTNTGTEFQQLTPTFFVVNQGGGTAEFIAAVPEPQTYLMLVAGLGLMGFVARRRANRDLA